MRHTAVRTKKQILDWMELHPKWVLQWCHGVRFNNWWWLRQSTTSSITIMVNTNAARAASKSCVLVNVGLNDSTYKLKRP